MAKSRAVSPKDYESALAELEAIVAEMESGQLLAAILQQFGAALVGGERRFQRQLTGFHFGHNGFQFGQCGLVILGGGGAGFGH